jgi:hypothetical protein
VVMHVYKQTNKHLAANNNFPQERSPVLSPKLPGAQFSYPQSICRDD